MNQLGEQEAKILAYTLAVKKLEAQIVTFQKQQLSLNEQLTFQANEIYAKDEKLKRYRRIGMKAVKEKEQLQKIVDLWKNSSKNLWKLVDSGMASNSKVGLGYEIQSNKKVLSYEEEMNRTVFQCTKKDFLNKPLYSRFSKTDNFKGVPHPLTGDYTPKPQEEIDDSLNPSEHSSESESESISVPNEMSASKSVITNEKVVSESKEVEPSCVTYVKTPRQQMKNQGTSEVKVKDLSHLIKDCDFYEKKMAREAELKKQRVINTGNGVAKPVWNNANRVNHANHFLSRPVQLNVGRSNINSVRPNINTGRTNVNSVRPRVNTGSSNVNTVRSRQPVPTRTSNSFSPKRSQGNWGTAVKTSAGYNWRNSRPNSNCDSGPTFIRTDHPLKNMEDRGIFDSGCSGHMTGNKDHLDDFEECKGGSVTFGGSKGYITGKGRIRVGNLDFDSVSFVKELGHFNLFSISQICDKHHKVLFTETECLVVSPDFKMPDKNQILLKVPRQHNMYSFDMKTHSLTKDYACLIAKATSDESKLWHRRFCWVFFLATKDETSGILQNFIRQIENQLNHRVKIIRSDNGTEFKNRDMLEFCRNKGIKQEYSNARTPQQNGVAERMNRTLIEAARTMLADSLLPTTFWAKAVSTACYIFNRVRVTKPQNKTPYELLFGHKPIISYIRPFGCHVTILDTLSVLGKFDGKCDEGFLVGYSLNSKAFRVYNLVTKKVEVNLHVKFLEEKPNVKGVDDDEDLSVVPTTISNLSQKAFRRDLDQLAQKHLREVTTDKATSTNSVNSGSEPANTQPANQDDSDMPELTIFNKHYKREFDAASYDEEYVADMLKKFDLASVKTAITPMETKMALTKDEEADDVDAHLYRSMIAAASCCGQVLWIQNQMLDYGFNFMNTKIHIDNESTICIVKNPVYHSKTKHIEIRHHFIRDSYEKKLIRVEKIHTDFNVPDLLTKSFDGPRFKSGRPMLILLYQLTKKIFGNMNRGFAGVYRPLLANTIAGHDENQGEPQEGPVESQPHQMLVPPSTSQPTTEPHPDQELETKAELHGSSSDFVHTPPTQVETSSPELKSISPEPMEHTCDQPQPSPVQQPASPEPQPTSPPKSPPLQGPTSTYAEATRINVADLLHLVPQLVTRIDNLEKELKENKHTTTAIIVKLVKKVKKLEARVKYGNLPNRKMVLSDPESEYAANSSKHGRNLGEEDIFETPKGKDSGEADISPSGLQAAETLVQVASQNTKTYTRRVESGFTNINSGEVRVSQRKGKEIARIQAQEAAEIERKAKLQRLDALAAKRLNDEFEMSEQQRKRAAKVQQQAQYYTEEDWDLIRARMEASTELRKSVFGTDIDAEDYAKKMVELVEKRKTGD
ncbi:ribonuclease H-like domain-containing protein [Tanacetum coccineum]